MQQAEERRIEEAVEQNDVAIRVRGLRNSFGDQVVHEQLDLDVRKGEILGVVGGSGTGKSVLMRSIIGLQTPDEGEVCVFGESMVGRLDDEALAIRKRWGVLFQGGALFSTLTVAENVEVPIREYYPNIGPQLRDEIAAYKIRMTGLPTEAGPKYPAELSGGMRKQTRRPCPRAGAGPRPAVPRRTHRRARPDRRGGVRRPDAQAAADAGPDRLPHHP